MSDNTIKLEIPVLLPDFNGGGDPRLIRLENALQNRKGIQRAHVEREFEPQRLCLHYDPSQISIADVRRTAERVGTQIASRYRHLALTVAGLDCSDCVVVLEHGLKRVEGVLDARASYANQQVFLEYDTATTNRPAIEGRITGLGYRVQRHGVRRWYEQNAGLLFSLASGLLLLTGWAGARFLGFAPQVSLGVYLSAYLAGGWDTARHAWHAVRMRTLDTDLLMVVAALGAAVLGEFAEGALLLFLFSLGHAVEDRTLERARQAIRALAQLSPKTAIVQRDSREVETPVDDLVLDEIVLVRAGTRLPVDGVILKGSSGVDQSPVTGESLPVEKSPGDRVFAGSVNGEGALQVRVTRLARDSTLARITKMVEHAQAQKTPTQQLADRFMRWFVPAVLVGDLLLIFIPPIFGVPLAESFRRAMTLLVAASPCALALGAPAAVLAGVAQAARNGVLIKGGAHLENLGRLRAIAFDKTGTITQGRPRVTDVISDFGFPLGDFSHQSAINNQQSEILRLAAAVESRSAHPLAQAIRSAAQGLPLPAVDEARVITGRGVQALIDDQTVLVGSAELLTEAGLEIPATVQSRLASLEGQGKTAVLVAQAGQLKGLIAVADVLRPGIRQVIAALRRIGLRRTILLTGDNERVAAHIAAEAGLDEIRSGLLPEEKVSAIQQLIGQEFAVAMVGDGVNDAPALAYATVGIAMGGAGTDVALETADVALMGDDLSKLPFAIGLGRATRSLIIQNIALALGVIAFLMSSAVLGWASLGLAVAIHEGSTVAVALNALRLLRYRQLG
jgi:Cd2+/Zn2+-exporting ATPase